MNVIYAFFKVLRPHQWSKNLLVFAAFVFSIRLMTLEDLYRNIVLFFLFSFVSGCVYVFNDYMDRENDKKHPEKCKRPIASGALPPNVALIGGGILLVSSLVTAYVLEPMIFVLLFVYATLNMLYSIKLKHVVIVDIMIIAIGFVLRAISGGVVIGVPFTPWFLLCTMVLALFLAIGKRRHEVVLLKEGKGEHRKVLAYYNVAFLDQMMSIVTTSSILSYALFVFTSAHSNLFLTLPFVIYGIFRYLYLIHVEGEGGKPSELLFADKPILATATLFGISVMVILYVG
jgi:4-hydroxybenzoate polyprenyltransferase